MQEKDKIMQFIQKNISNSENNQKIHCEFDLKFELSRLDTLKEKVKSLEQDIEEYKSVVERERAEKKRLMSVYN